MSDTIKRSIKLEMDVQETRFEFNSDEKTLWVFQDGRAQSIDINEEINEQLIFFLTRVHEEFINERA